MSSSTNAVGTYGKRRKPGKFRSLHGYSWRLLLLELAMLPVAAIMVFPFYFVIINTLKPKQEVLQNSLTLPRTLYLDNYAEAFSKMNLSISFTNTLAITTVSVLLIVLFGAMAAYPVSRFANRWTKVVFAYFLVGFMVPLQTTLVPLFIVIKNLELVNKIGGLMLIYSAQCVFSFFLYQ